MPSPAARGRSRSVRIDLAEASQLQPERNDRELASVSDVEALRHLPPLSLREHHHPGRGPSDAALQRDEGTGAEAREIVSPEDVAVERVDADGNSRRGGRCTTERPRLGGVRVHDRGSLGGEETAQREQAPEVPHRPDLACHGGQEGRLHAALPRVP